MENEVNVRYGVVNEEIRADYEKQWQLQKGYDFITYDLEKATEVCKKMGKNWSVEKIYNIPNSVVNYKVIVFKC